MRKVVIGILGFYNDHPTREWRPTLSLFTHEEFPIDELVLIYSLKQSDVIETTKSDIQALSSETIITPYPIDYINAWDYKQIYSLLRTFSRSYKFDTERNSYYVHISTGTHAMQISLFKLIEAGHIPGQLLQTYRYEEKGCYSLIDLKDSCYDEITTSYQGSSETAISYLKGGIETRNIAFNQLISELEQVAIKSLAPILLTGPTGAGKSQLAKRIYDLKKDRGPLSGALVSINCATLRGDNAMSALFGHVKGAFTGALKDRQGFLKDADKGLLFLDEIGELGLDEQAMLLRAIEDKVFIPFGGNAEVNSDFQLIAGTNRDLFAEVKKGTFREDLLARINLWTYRLPSLKERIEDLEPNIKFELQQLTEKAGRPVDFNTAARAKYLKFAHSPQALWRANFRDLNSSITRMVELSNSGRINEDDVAKEIRRLQINWSSFQESVPTKDDRLSELLPEQTLAEIDLIDRIQLSEVVRVCRECRNMAEAGRKLYNISRTQKSTGNDSNRLRNYLKRYDLDFKSI